MSFDVQGYSDKADQLQITVDQDEEIVKIIDYHVESEHLYITLESVSPGRAFVSVDSLDNPISNLGYRSVYVNRLMIITEDDFFGRSTGSWCFPIAITIF